MTYNLLLDTDSYKASHWLQYPPGSEGLFAYVESRGGCYPATVFFGLQYILQTYLTQPLEQWMVEEAQEFYQAHGLPFNAAGFTDIVQRLDGRLPIRIRAVPEGTVVPVSNVLMSVESTDPACFWLVTWLETMLLRVWYPTTVATQGYYLRQLIYDYLVQTADDPEAEIDFKLHDFGARGVSSCESSGIGGMAHLVNFQGSDTVQGVVYANRYYDCPMAGFSIPAAEHSTMTAWGRAGEVDAYRNMLQKFARPGALVAVVSDSYDIWNAIAHLWGSELRQQVTDSGATVVIRPDSGDPKTVVIRCLNLLAEAFGTVTNSKGYRVLQHVRLIQGDGMNLQSIRDVMAAMVAQGFSISNVAFGMGGALLQQVNRDTQQFAYKCSSIAIAGSDHPIAKNPATDPRKRSKAGRLDLIHDSARGYRTVTLAPEQSVHPDSVLQTVYQDGEILQAYTLTEVRANARQGLQPSVEQWSLVK